MRKIAAAVALLGAVACSSNGACDNKKYEANWESLSQHEEIPEWLSDAKLGIYFHWGVYNVPEVEHLHAWYAYYMYRPGNRVYDEHRAKYGADFNYHDFIDGFSGENFDAKEWAQLFKDAGARFAGPCAIHHDGFSMWDSEANPYNAKDMGPKTDITGELLRELKALDMKTITTFHHSRNIQRNADNPKEWVSGGKADCGYSSHFAYEPSLVTATKDPDLKKFYGNFDSEAESNEYWSDLVAEVVDQYSPDMIWFDSWFNMVPEKARQEMAAYYYNEAKCKGQDVTIGYKQDDLPLEVGILDIEQGGKMELSERVWMTDITMGTSHWSYVDGMKYKTPEMILRNMIDVWSKNGVVLFNVSPTVDGTIPAEQRAIMHSIGGWLNKYGEAIYGTVPHILNGFGTATSSAGSHGGQSATTDYTAEDVRFTCSKDGKSLYLIFLGKPEVGAEVNIRSFAPQRYPTSSPVKRITLLGTDIEAEFDMNLNQCMMTIPNAEMDDMATVFKFELE